MTSSREKKNFKNKNSVRSLQINRNKIKSEENENLEKKKSNLIVNAKRWNANIRRKWLR